MYFYYNIVLLKITPFGVFAGKIQAVIFDVDKAMLI